MRRERAGGRDRELGGRRASRTGEVGRDCTGEGIENS